MQHCSWWHIEVSKKKLNQKFMSILIQFLVTVIHGESYITFGEIRPSQIPKSRINIFTAKNFQTLSKQICISILPLRTQGHNHSSFVRNQLHSLLIESFHKEFCHQLLQSGLNFLVLNIQIVIIKYDKLVFGYFKFLFDL